MIYFLKGFTLGIAYVAPIGVQNLFAINTSLTQSKKRAYIIFYGGSLLYDFIKLAKTVF